MIDARCCSNMRRSWNTPRPSGSSRKILPSNHRSDMPKTNMFQRPSRRRRILPLLSTYFLNGGSCRGQGWVTIGQGSLAERPEIERLIAEDHSSEGLTPIKERIAWAVDQQLRGQSSGLLLVAREKGAIVGVALAVYTPSAELGRVMTVNDFFVRPDHRRRAVGRELANCLVEECRRMNIDEIGLEVLHSNKTAAAFWNSAGFQQGRSFSLQREAGIGDDSSSVRRLRASGDDTKWKVSRNRLPVGRALSDLWDGSWCWREPSSS